jgi:hypothetical protein
MGSAAQDYIGLYGGDAKLLGESLEYGQRAAWDLRFRLRPPMLYLVWSLPSCSKTQRNLMNFVVSK